MKSAYPKKIVGHIYKSPLCDWYMRCTIAYSDGAAAMEYLTGEMAGKVDVVNGQTVLDYVGHEGMIKPKLVNGVYKNPASGVYMRCVHAHALGGADMVHMTGAYKGHKYYIPNNIELQFIGTTPRDNTPINKGGYVSGAREYMVGVDNEMIDCTTLGGESYQAPAKRNNNVGRTEICVASILPNGEYNYNGHYSINRLMNDIRKDMPLYPVMLGTTVCHNKRDALRVITGVLKNENQLTVTINGKVSEEEAEAFKKKWNDAQVSVKLQPGMVFTPVDDVPEMVKNDQLYIQQYGRGLRIKKKKSINWVWAGIVTWCILSIITAGAFAFNVIMGIIK